MLVAVGIGAIVVVAVTDREPHPQFVLLGPQVPVEFDEDATIEPDASESDPRIEYPEALSELPSQPRELAIDPNSGDLWFVGSDYYNTTNHLYRYDVSTGQLLRRPIPAAGNGLFSPIAISSAGHVIVAEGALVLDVDPKGGYVEHELPPTGYITDMVLSDDDKAYVAKAYVAAIIELDLRTGEVSEIPLPGSMALVQQIELAGGQLWMAAPIATEDMPAQTAVLDLETGETELIPTQISTAVADWEGRVFVSRQVAPGVVAVDSRDGSIEAGPWTFTREHDGLSWAPERLASDNERGRIWMAGGGSGIVSIEPATGKEEYYPLPSVAETVQFSGSIRGCEGMEGCATGRPAFTSVGGIAVAPNGDLFFSDQSYNRIGIVHPR